MSTMRKSTFYSLALMLFLTPVKLLARSAMSLEPHCFSIHVHLNGKTIAGPHAVTFNTQQIKSTVPLESGCFTVPSSLLNEKSIDVSFTVGKNRIYLSQIETGFFAGPWDIALADKRFNNDVNLPKHALAKKACVVVFHVGEPETSLVQTGCRRPL